MSSKQKNWQTAVTYCSLTTRHGELDHHDDLTPVQGVQLGGGYHNYIRCGLCGYLYG